MSPNSSTSKAPRIEQLLEILVRICAVADVDPADAQLIKYTNNAVFRLPVARLVVRIAGSQTVRERIPKVINVARWLAEQDIPSIRLYERVKQPIIAAGHSATVWWDAPHHGPPPSGEDLGEILRQLHALPLPDFELPPWRPVQTVRQRIAEAEGLPAHDVAFLVGACDEAEGALAEVEYELQQGPIHGDSFLGNLISAPGHCVICDFDSSSIGPREWDLIPVAVGKVRFDYADDAHDQLTARYGFDVTRWRGFDVLRHVRELQLVTSVLPVLGSNPSLLPQWRFRYSTFRDGDSRAIWTPYK